MDHSEVDIKWQKFSISGSVRDYLDYKKSEQIAENKGQER